MIFRNGTSIFYVGRAKSDVTRGRAIFYEVDCPESRKERDRIPRKEELIDAPDKHRPGFHRISPNISQAQFNSTNSISHISACVQANVAMWRNWTNKLITMRSMLILSRTGRGGPQIQAGLGMPFISDVDIFGGAHRGISVPR